MCCNGVIFADVRLQPGDDPALMKSIGLQLSGDRSFKQPCSALEGCRCRVYENRPAHCRGFECRLLKRVQAGQFGAEVALGVIKGTQAKAEEIRDLFQALGDTDSHQALRTRFRRLQRRLEKVELSRETAEIYGRLTLAVHSLNLRISQWFYS